MPLECAVRNFMSKPLITVDLETIILTAIKLMIEKNIGALVVTERNEPVGMVTERDILKKCSPDPSLFTKARIKEIMSIPLVTVDGDTLIGSALKIMTEKNIRRLLITEKGKIVGIITDKDLMRATLDTFYLSLFYLVKKAMET